MAQLSIRIEEKTKREASKTLKALGLDMSSAVKLFLNQVVVEQGIPFKPTRSPEEVRKAYDAEIEEVLKNSKSYRRVSHMFRDILKSGT